MFDDFISEATRCIESERSTILSIITSANGNDADSFLSGLQEKVREVIVINRHQARRALLPNGQFASQDRTVIGQGVLSAPHQDLYAIVVTCRSPTAAARELAELAEQAASHLERVQRSRRRRREAAPGGCVFIGHGRSPLWRELKDFVQDRLGLRWDEFNRVPVAGVTNVERLVQMLDNAGVALLVLTAEDEHVDGSVAARQNVIHEAGLFQGRLGFSRAIILLEEDCEEFTNIAGLGQIRFPKGDIGRTFEEIRRVLEREGFLGT
jgi:predicted nucleotide-binding protein